MTAPTTHKPHPLRYFWDLPFRLSVGDRLPSRARADLVRAYCDNILVPVPALNLAAAALLIILLQEGLPGRTLAGWGGALLAASLGRLAVAAGYRARRGQAVTPETWAAVCMVLAAVNGGLWGAGAAWSTDLADPSQRLLLVAVVVALSAAEFIGGAALLGCAAAFAGPALLLPAARLLWRGDGAEVALGVLLGVLAPALVGLARRGQAAPRGAAEGGARNGAFYRALVESMPGLLLMADNAQRIVYAGPSVLRLLGYGPEDLHGTPLMDIVHADDIPALRAGLDAGSVAALPRLRRKDGGWLPVVLHGRRIPGGEGDAPHLVVSAEDASTPRRAQEALKLAKERAEDVSRAKAEFLATMSHEIRTPMGGMIGLIDLLKATGLTDKQQQYVHALDRAGEHLSDLLNDILDFSKIEANKLEAETATFDLSKVIGGVMDIFRAQADAKGVVMRAVIAPEVQSTWQGDLRHLRQVLANLLGNAVKYTDEGHVEVGVSRHSTTQDGRVLIQVAVEDTGVGIAPEKLPHIFDPFAQADPDAARRQGGTGLGLTISRRLVEFMKGRIWAVSREGLGSTFYIRIPLVPAEAFPEAATPAAAQRFAATSVLVVDDSDLNRLVLGDMLSGLGMKPETAANGVEALRAFTEREYGLVFIDMQMPVMDGLAAVRALRGFETETGRRRCPVVALSATALKEDRDAALEAGCDEFVIKPLRKDALVMLLKTYVPSRHGQGAASGKPRAPAGEDVIEPELAPLLPSFVQHLRLGLADLGAALDSGDMAGAAKLVHQVKGNAMLFGMKPLTALLSELETTCRMATSARGEAFIEQADRALSVFAGVEAEAERAMRRVAAEAGTPSEDDGRTLRQTED